MRTLPGVAAKNRLTRDSQLARDSRVGEAHGQVGDNRLVRDFEKDETWEACSPVKGRSRRKRQGCYPWA